MHRDPNRLAREGRFIVERLGGKWARAGGLCLCPAHDDRNPSLSIRVGKQGLLVHCFAGCRAADILRLIRRLGHPGDADVGAMPAEDRLRRPGRFSESATRIWANARIVAGTPAEDYLRSRAIDGPTPELRYHPRTPLGPSPGTRFLPALIAPVRDDTGLIAIHRTFLDLGKAGLAEMDMPKRALGALGSGAVRIGGSGPRLGLAEGLETALSASRLFGLPCWAVLGTERFRRVRLPRATTSLVLFVDHDSGGARAEALARATFGHDLSIEVERPAQPGQDWNDVLRSRSC